MYRDKRNQHGFSLIELLVAIFLVTMVLGVTYTVYFSSSRAATQQTQDSRMQDNARLAMDEIVRNFMMAGYMIQEEKYPYGYNLGSPALGSMKMKATTAASVNGDDQVILSGFVVSGSTTTLTATAPMGATLLSVESPVPPAASIIDIGMTDSAVVSSLSGSTLALAFNSSGGQKLLNIRRWGSGSTNMYGQPLTPTKVRRLEASQMAISWDDPLHPVLTQDGQPLADDIEDMQIAYGVDLDSNYRITAGEWMSMPIGTDINKIKLVRVTLVARTAQPDPKLIGVTRVVPALEDHPARDVTNDGYRRYILRRIIHCRNMETSNPM
jgi:type IV pilus assembly protein PilW